MGHIRERVAWAMAGTLALMVIASLVGVVRGGPLDPPAPPAPTQLTQINSLPYTINVSGSYILTQNLTGPGGSDGITINAADVTLDLRGFALVGPGGIGHENGIFVMSGGRLAVRNGIVREWGGYGLYNLYPGQFDHLSFDHDGFNNGSDGFGVYLRDASLSDCVVNNSGTALGVGLRAESSVLERCEFNASPGAGLYVSDGSATHIAAHGNGKAGIVATYCTITDADVEVSGGDGIVTYYSVVTNSVTIDNGGNGILASFGKATITNNTVADNKKNGIDLAKGGFDQVSGNSVSNNTLDGILVETTSPNNTISDNTVSGNSVNGVHVVATNATRIQNNNVSGNTGRGIWIDTGGTNNSVVDNTVSGNGIEGILVFPGGNGNLIDANHSSGNTSNNIAIDNLALGAKPNVITRNWAIRGGAGNYAIGANNDAAPQTTAATAANPMANVGTP